MKDEIKKGDIYYANLEGAMGSEQNGNRPVMIVQNNIGNKYADTVIVLPITKKMDRRTKLPTHIPIKAYKGIKVDSTILAEQIRTIDKSRLSRKICKIPDSIIAKVDTAMEIALGIIESKKVKKMGLFKRLIYFFGGKI